MIQGQVVWYEIPVMNLERAMLFYRNVLSVKIETNKFLEQEYAVLNIDKSTTKGVLVKKENVIPQVGIVIFFYVIDMSESLKSVVEFGGQIVTEKTLIKKKTADGNYSIGSNLIDDNGNTGYFSELIDCEGNKVSLYSNS